MPLIIENNDSKNSNPPRTMKQFNTYITHDMMTNSISDTYHKTCSSQILVKSAAKI